MRRRAWKRRCARGHEVGGVLDPGPIRRRSSAELRAQCRRGPAFRHEHKRDSVVAPSLAGGRRTVAEHMALVTLAPCAVILRAWQHEPPVPLGLQAALDRSVEAGATRCRSHTWCSHRTAADSRRRKYTCRAAFRRSAGCCAVARSPLRTVRRRPPGRAVLRHSASGFVSFGTPSASSRADPATPTATPPTNVAKKRLLFMMLSRPIFEIPLATDCGIPIVFTSWMPAIGLWFHRARRWPVAAASFRPAQVTPSLAWPRLVQPPSPRRAVTS